MNTSENRIFLVNRSLCALILLLTVVTSAYGQVNSEILFNSLKLKEQNSKIYTKPADKIRKDSASKSFEFPVQLSFEYGYGIERIEDSYKGQNYKMWSLGLDVNLYSRIIFLTLEYGELNRVINNDKGYYVSIGPKIRYLKTSHHNLFVHIGLLPSPMIVVGGILVSAKYLYAFNPYIGVSMGVKYFYTGRHFISLMGGIQIFTN